MLETKFTSGLVDPTATMNTGDAVAIILGVDDNTPVASMANRTHSYGESLVGLSFNPSNDRKVYRIKSMCATLIDAMDELRRTTDDGEVKRLASIAITEVESSAMWMFKALTK